jgi:hypothetical protein
LLAGRQERVIDQTLQPEIIWLWLAPLSERQREG